MNSMRLLSVLVLSVFLLACGDSSDKKKVAEPDETVFRLSGSITPASNSDYDSDMQPRVGSILLDSTIKALNNPVTLGGYLSGSAGFYSSEPEEEGDDFDADAQDRYVIALAANQQIRLSVFFADREPELQAHEIDVRLSLRAESAPNVVLQEFTVNSETTRSLAVAQSGQMIIQLDALNASSPVLYTLTVSEPVGGAAVSQEPVSMSSDFVPGEVIVQLKSAQQ